jgi:hypothetical protein
MIGNRYRKIEKGGVGAGIGSGTYGEVFKCEDTQEPGVIVACKVSRWYWHSNYFIIFSATVFRGSMRLSDDVH